MSALVYWLVPLSPSVSHLLLRPDFVSVQHLLSRLGFVSVPTHGGIEPLHCHLAEQFFLSNLAQIFAFPAFTAFTFTLVFFFAVRRMFFFPEVIVHLFFAGFLYLKCSCFSYLYREFLAVVNARVKIIAMFFVFMRNSSSCYFCILV